jgi:hypothetical protein
MDETQKLRMLLPHWIEHNGEHAAEFRAYAERSDTAREPLGDAARLMEETNARLSAALAVLGGPLEHP